MKAIILGSSRGIRHLDTTQGYPASLKRISTHDNHNREARVLDWILHAFKSQSIPEADIHFVGGYHFEKVVESYPGLSYYFHRNWHTESDLGALRLVQNALSGPCFICTTNIIFRPDALSLLKNSAGDIVFGTLSPLTTPSPSTSLDSMAISEIGYFTEVGVIRLKTEIQETEASTHTLKTFFSKISFLPHGVSFVALDSQCITIHERTSLPKFIMGSKAETLERLKPLVKHSQILDQVRFNITTWHENPIDILQSIYTQFGHNSDLIIRSSSIQEDGWQRSNAGRFKSIVTEAPQTDSKLKDAITQVANSFPPLASSQRPDEIFVQLRLDPVSASGVVLTRDMETASPYYIITLDRHSGKTDTITSGAEVCIETHIIYRHAEHKAGDPIIDDILTAVREIESLINHDSLDIEFAVSDERISKKWRGSSGEKRVVIFQVRPLISNTQLGVAEQDLIDEVSEAKRFIQDAGQPHPTLVGTGTILATMSDWNPAEMIGITPRPLSLSLYKTLITDNAWSIARKQLGYRDVGQIPLLLSLTGVPYIDLRTSFNSLIPSGIADGTAERLVNYYLQKLSQNPHLHDKIEFDIALTTLAFDFDQKKDTLREAGLTSDEIAAFHRALFQITQPLLETKDLIKIYLSAFHTLATRREKLLQIKPSSTNLPRIIATLTQDCIHFGTIPFSILARLAFIAISFLRSLQTISILSQDEANTLLRSIPTVASQIAMDINRLTSGALSRKTFLKKYGHLRAGTYDIRSPNYSQIIDQLATSSNFSTTASPSPPGHDYFETKASAIDPLLRQLGYHINTTQLWRFIKDAIAAREYAKFEFTKSVNEILEKIALFGEYNNLSREMLSFVPIEAITQYGSASQSSATRSILKRISHFGEKRYMITKAIRLPHLIERGDDLDGFNVLEWRPNFVTTQQITSEWVDLDKMPLGTTISGKIILVSKADPGLDWIFGFQPAGLITEFGGAASHMAIRAAEFSLPAAIGCGPLRYNRLKQYPRIHLDCAAQTIKAV